MTYIDTKDWVVEGSWKIAPAGLSWIAEGSKLQIGDNAKIGHSAKIGNSAKIEDWAAIGDYTMIGNYATIGNSSKIGRYTKIGNWATIGNGATIGDNAKIGHYTKIGYYATIGDGATIGDWAAIGDNAKIGNGTEEFIEIGRADGYIKIICMVKGVAYIGAGCRWFTLAEALIHWKTPGREMTMCLMQSAIAIATLKGWRFDND